MKAKTLKAGRKPVSADVKKVGFTIYVMAKNREKIKAKCAAIALQMDK